MALTELIRGIPMYFKVRRLGRQLIQAVEAHPAIEEIVPFVYEFSEGHALWEPPRYVPSELIGLLKEVRHRQPRTIVRIGSITPSELFLLSRAAAPDARLIIVGKPPISGIRVPDFLRRRFVSQLTRGRQRLYFLADNRCTPKTAGRLRKILGKQRIDFLWLDRPAAQKTLAYCLEQMKPLLNRNALIAISHIRADQPKKRIENATFWQQVRKQLRGKAQEFKAQSPELVKRYTGSALGGGIGLLILEASEPRSATRRRSSTDNRTRRRRKP